MVNLLEDIQRGVRRMDVGRPKGKALPMSKIELQRFLAGSLLPIRAMALLAFRTASRVGDLMPLRPQDLTLTPEGLLVQFVWTKPNPEAEKRADHRILVRDPPQDLLRWWRSCRTKKLMFERILLDRLKRSLREMTPNHQMLSHWKSMDPQNQIKDHYTLHSFKRGAAALAWEAAAKQEISIHDLLTFLKHKDVKSALEYCPCPMLAAKVVGSSASHVTRL